jgi:cupin fold WbuC family metalloprotein
LDVFSKEYLDTMISDANDSVRKRQHRNTHRSFDEKCQRLMNAIGVESYIAPHRHLLDPKSECLIAVRGLFAAVIFSDNGNVEQIEFFGTEKFKNLSVGLELPLGVWHTVVAITHGSALFEVKEGPFYPKKAKEFAPWAPSEGSADAQDYLRQLRALCKQWLLESPGDRTFETYSVV